MQDQPFDLPRELIAQEPAQPRDSARLWVQPTDGQEPSQVCVRDLPRFLRKGDLLVTNNTKVLPARLWGQRETGGRVELLLLEPSLQADAPLGTWSAMVSPSQETQTGGVAAGVR